MIVHIISVLVALMLSYFLISQVRGYKIGQGDILSVLISAIVFYIILIQLYPIFYVEYFDINPNIVEINTHDYQESQLPPSKKKSHKTSPTTCKTNVNIYLDGELASKPSTSLTPASSTPSTPSSTPLTPASTPSTPLNPQMSPLTPTKRPAIIPGRCQYNLKPQSLHEKATQLHALSHAIGQSPSTHQRSFDDGNTCPMSGEDPAIIHHVRSNIQHVLAQHYPLSLKEKDTPYAMNQLREVVAQKIDAMMPYISNQIREETMLHLDQIIDQEIDQMVRNQGPPTILPHHLEGRTQVGTLRKDLSTGHPEYIPETYMNTMGEIQNNRVYYDHPRDAYRDVNYGWSYQQPQPPLTTYVESVYNGVKLGVDRLFSPIKHYLLSNELSLPNRWNVRPWQF